MTTQSIAFVISSEKTKMAPVNFSLKKKSADNIDSVLLLSLQVWNVREKKRKLSTEGEKQSLATYKQAQIRSKRHYTELAEGKDGLKLNRC